MFPMIEVHSAGIRKDFAIVPDRIARARASSDRGGNAFAFHLSGKDALDLELLDSFIRSVDHTVIASDRILL